MAFAGSDIATRWAGWMGGAIVSGKAAATYLNGLLA